MVRLPAEHPLRAAGSLAARNAANAHDKTRDLFYDAVPIPTGYALIARDPTNAATAIQAAESLYQELGA